ncbi:alkaline phosphatase D family protein [Nocardioidaceae bacterium]|nr:alkaline phosphatase D family protein [Nocardioidaceae bacterium]
MGLGATVPAEAAGRRRQVFAHGVASGDPHPRSVILWTRVTPTPASRPGSRKGPRVQVRWEVATDRRFRSVVRRGSITTGPSRDHTVKIEAGRLEPATDYFYRFTCRGVRSATGRTRTAPAPDARVRRLRWGVVSCANLQAGWFSPYRHLADRDDLDLVLHLGDYLYEYAPGEYGYGNDQTDIRSHVPAREMVSLADYRQRHAQYKTDRDLQRLHARYPFVVTWDDHETTNDAWRHGAENHQAGEGAFKRRKRRAHRAYDEWMPVRMGRTGSADLKDGRRLFRRLTFGRLAELTMLDLRSYRSLQSQTEVSDPARTITGQQQMDFLKASLDERRAQWKLVGNPVMITPVVFPPLPAELTAQVNDVTGILPDNGVPYNVDQWDGYTADRREVLEHIVDEGVKNTVFLCGDIHSSWANDVPLDAGTYPLELGRSVANELVCTSVTSNNLDDITGTPAGTSSRLVETAFKVSNRHVKYLDFDLHGYSVFEVTPGHAQMDYFVISDRADRRATSRLLTSCEIPTDTATVRPAAQPLRER